MWQQKIWHIFQYFRYKIYAKHRKGHGVHSPFVFAFITDILEEKQPYYCFEEIEKTRQLLCQNNQKIFVDDFGTGRSNHRKISSIARKSLKSKKFAQLIFRIIAFYKPTTIIELGTSLGITSSYIASANKQAKVFSFEGSTEIAKIAKNNMDTLHLSNINIITGDITTQLPLFLANSAQIDMIFFDANHKKEPTLSYFNMCVDKIGKKALFIFDDIYWSKEMKEAWEEICADTRIQVSIDLFSIGIVFIDPELKKKHYTIYY